MTVCRRDRLVILIVCGWSLHAGSLRAEETAPAPFKPAEISIGEPLQLPPRSTGDSLPAAPNDSPAIARGAVAPPAAAVPGNGWIGLTVDEKVVTGRLVVVDVAAAGPADQAGIRVQDQLLAIDGVPLRSADQLAAALAAIAPGSTVKAAIGRGDQIEEVALTAAARPAKSTTPPTPPAASAGSSSREWQPAEAAAPPIAKAPAPRVALPPSTAPDVAPRRPPASAPTPPPAFVPTPSPAMAAAPAPAPSRVTPAPAGSAPAGKGRTALGVRTLPVDPAMQARFRLPEPAGALVIGVVHDLPASKAGVPPGSVIVALDNQPVRSPNELSQIVTRGPVGRPVTLQYILPGGEQRRAEVSLQSLEVPLERALVGPEP